MGILCFADILRKVNINPANVKLIRHALTDKNFRECYNRHMVYEYTCHQRSGFSTGYDYWAVFISDAGTLAKFNALYKVNGFVADTTDVIPQGLPEPEAKHYDGTGSVYRLQHSGLLREYEEKLTIDWGKSTRMWHQKGTTEKPIISILPDKKKVFAGFEDLVLSFEELEEIVCNQEIYDAWHTALSSVYAIYLIVDTSTGMQYVGSAYGEGGLLGRWRNYVDTRHGGNKKMRAMLTEHPERYKSFQFSILQILPKTITDESVIALESLYKKKLMSIQFGLNDN